MKLRLRSLLLPLFFALPSLTLPFIAGCKQGVGERCQLDSDCDTGHCVLPTNATAQQGGTCQDTVTDDSGITVDMATPPVTQDLATPSADLAGSADLATVPDLAATPDLATTPDLAVKDGGAGD